MKRVKPLPCSLPLFALRLLSLPPSPSSLGCLSHSRGARSCCQKVAARDCLALTDGRGPHEPSFSWASQGHVIAHSARVAPESRLLERFVPVVFSVASSARSGPCSLARSIDLERCRTSCVSYCAVSGFEFPRRPSTRCVGLFDLDNRESRSVPSPRSARLSLEHRWVFRRRQALALN